MGEEETLELNSLLHQTAQNIQKKKRGRPSNEELAARAGGISPSAQPSLKPTAGPAPTAPVVTPAAPVSVLTPEQIEVARAELNMVGDATSMLMGSERFKYSKEFLDQNEKLAALTLARFMPAVTSEKAAPWLLLMAMGTYAFSAWIGTKADKQAAEIEKAKTAPIMTAATLNSKPPVAMTSSNGSKDAIDPAKPLGTA